MTTGGAESAAARVQPVVFEHISVEAFRGFNERTDFDLNASVVIVHGPNGMGKTSLFDAMQWLLIGELPRVATVRLRTTEEHIVNAYRIGGSARVAARVRIGDKVVELTRVGDRSSSTLAWVEEGSTALVGARAQEALEASFSASEQMDLKTSLTACGLLQQDAARLVLEAKPRDRFAIFSQLLGLSDLEKFEDWTQARAKRAKTTLTEASEALTGAERGAEHARGELARALELAAQRPAVDSVMRRLTDVVASMTSLRVGSPANRDEAVALSAAAQRHAGELGALAVALVSIIESENVAPPEGELEAAFNRAQSEVESSAQNLTLRRTSLASARAALSAANSAQEGLSRMAASVLPQLIGDECPVCGQAIVSSEVRQHLEELAADDGAVSALSTAVREQDADIARLEAAHREAQERVSGLQAQLRRLAGLRQEVQLFQERLRAVQASEVISTGPVPETSRDLLNWLQQARSEAALLGGVAQEYIAALDASGGVEEARAKQAVASAEINVRELAALKKQAESANQEAVLLHEAASAGRLDVVASEFSRLGPVAQNVFSRLDPHPTFTELELETDVLRSASTATARVRDVSQDVTADPMVIFSAAQANIAAISYLVALNWTSASRVPLLMLDDPLQAMDDINVLGFADLCRHLRSRRQVIVSTHERRFAQLLERKLAPREDQDRTIVHEFVGWERSGPLVKERSMGAGSA
jgi:DNA repair exonuclease SbcCD ATPase subunit